MDPSPDRRERSRQPRFQHRHLRRSTDRPSWWQLRRKKLCPGTAWTQPHSYKPTDEDIGSHPCDDYCHHYLCQCRNCPKTTILGDSVPEVRLPLDHSTRGSHNTRPLRPNRSKQATRRSALPAKLPSFLPEQIISASVMKPAISRPFLSNSSGFCLIIFLSPKPQSACVEQS